MITSDEFVFVPLAEPPTDLELTEVQCIEPVTVIMRTWVDPHSGKPKYVSEQFADPDTGQDTVVWSRVTDSLSYVRGSQS